MDCYVLTAPWWIRRGGPSAACRAFQSPTPRRLKTHKPCWHTLGKHVYFLPYWTLETHQVVNLYILLHASTDPELMSSTSIYQLRSKSSTSPCGLSISETDVQLWISPQSLHTETRTLYTHTHTYARTHTPPQGQWPSNISQWTVISDSLSSPLHYLPSNSSLPASSGSLTSHYIFMPKSITFRWKKSQKRNTGTCHMRKPLNSIFTKVKARSVCHNELYF